jgi:hypothetical protein
MRVVVFLTCLLGLCAAGCQSATIEKGAKPVVAPIQKTTEKVFQERTLGSEDGTQAVLFPKEQESDDHKQFKLKF